jgi:hypothetical protein
MMVSGEEVSDLLIVDFKKGYSHDIFSLSRVLFDMIKEISNRQLNDPILMQTTILSIALHGMCLATARSPIREDCSVFSRQDCLNNGSGKVFVYMGSAVVLLKDAVKREHIFSFRFSPRALLHQYIPAIDSLDIPCFKAIKGVI